MEAENVFVKFRRMLVEDDNFRARFAENPAEALRSLGIDIPQGVELAKIDKADLDERVRRLKVEFGESLETVFASPRGITAKVVANRRLDNLVVPVIRPGDTVTSVTRPGATVYTISAFGTADW